MIFLMVIMKLSQLRLGIEFGEDDNGDEEILDDEREVRKSVGAHSKESVLADLQWRFSP